MSILRSMNIVMYQKLCIDRTHNHTTIADPPTRASCTHAQLQHPHSNTSSSHICRVASVASVLVAVKLLLSQQTWELVSVAYQ